MPTLDWIGKSKVINHHQEVPFRILERQYSFDENGQHLEDNGSENMIIHGDNLEALKALLPRYEGKIKCIYIDPPYNTAKSKNSNQVWVYNDNVDHPVIKKWLGKIVDDIDTDFCRHDKWLCMMYPRLKLLYKLLSHDGVILISIDDNELSHLSCVCNEIFGERNHVATFIWHSEGHTDNQEDVTNVHEYILCYAKNKKDIQIERTVDPNVPDDSKIRRDFAENSITKNGKKNPASTIELPVGFPCEIGYLMRPALNGADAFVEQALKKGYIEKRQTKDFNAVYPVPLDDMVVEEGKLTKPCRVFSGWTSAAKLRQFIQNDCQPIDDKGAALKYYLSKNGVIYYRKMNRTPHYVCTVLRQMGTTEVTKNLLEKMDIDFDYPKPVELISYLLKIFTSGNDIVLDSFAGSASTAHAVLEDNRIRYGQRRFILIEMEDYAETKTACRVKHVINSNQCEHFSYYELGEPLMVNGNLNSSVETAKIREYIWFMETKTPYKPQGQTHPHFLGTINDTSYYFYYEREQATVLNDGFLATLTQRTESMVIYADRCTINPKLLAKMGIIFKKIPRDIAKL